MSTTTVMWEVFFLERAIVGRIAMGKKSACKQQNKTGWTVGNLERQTGIPLEKKGENPDRLGRTFLALLKIHGGEEGEQRARRRNLWHSWKETILWKPEACIPPKRGMTPRKKGESGGGKRRTNYEISSVDSDLEMGDRGKKRGEYPGQEGRLCSLRTVWEKGKPSCMKGSPYYKYKWEARMNEKKSLGQKKGSCPAEKCSTRRQKRCNQFKTKGSAGDVEGERKGRVSGGGLCQNPAQK